MEFKFVPSEEVTFDKSRKLTSKAYALTSLFVVFCVFVMSLSGFFCVAIATPLAAIALTVVFLFSGSFVKSLLPILISVVFTVASALMFGGNPVVHISALAFIPLSLMAFVALKNNFRRIEFICFVSAVSVFLICLGVYFYYAVSVGSYDPSVVVSSFKTSFDGFVDGLIAYIETAIKEFSSVASSSIYSSAIANQDPADFVEQIRDMIYMYLLILPALVVIISNIIAFVMSVGIKFLSDQYKPFEMVPSLWPFTVSALSGVLYLISNLGYIIALLSSNGDISDSLVGIILYNVYSVLSVSFFAFGLSVLPRILIVMRKQGKAPLSPMIIVLLLVFLFLSPMSLISILVSLVTFFGVALSIWAAILRFKHNLNSKDM